MPSAKTSPEVSFAMESTTYPSIALAGTLLLVFELPPAHLFLQSWLGPGHLWVHAIVAVVHVVSAVWLLFDARQVKRSTLRFSEGTLRVRIGGWWSVDIPREVVTAVETGPVATKDALTARATVFDAPNVTLVLDREVVVTGRAKPRRARRIALFIDSPGDLAALLDPEGARLPVAHAARALASQLVNPAILGPWSAQHFA